MKLDETEVKIKTTGDIYEVAISGQRNAELVSAILDLILKAENLWCFDGTFRLGPPRRQS
jgi:hypothetical protein